MSVSVALQLRVSIPMIQPMLQRRSRIKKVQGSTLLRVCEYSAQVWAHRSGCCQSTLRRRLARAYCRFNRECINAIILHWPIYADMTLTSLKTDLIKAQEQQVKTASAIRPHAVMKREGNSAKMNQRRRASILQRRRGSRAFHAPLRGSSAASHSQASSSRYHHGWCVCGSIKPQREVEKKQL